jgi:hypothetical protein
LVADRHHPLHPSWRASASNSPQQRRRPALQVAVEERQRVRVDDAVRPLDADRSGETQAGGERRQQWDVGQVDVDMPGTCT